MLPGVKPQGRGTAALLLCVVLVFLGAGLIAPWAYGLLHVRLDYPFHSYVDRCLMITALAAIPLFWNRFGLASWRDLGVRPEGKGEIAWGLALGLISAATMLGAAIALGGRMSQNSAGWEVILILLATAAIVAPLEELLFRGVIQTVLVRDIGAGAGIAATSLFFAVVHFIKVPVDFAPQPVTAWSGLAALGLAFAPFADCGAIASRFLLLAAVGAVLGVAAWRTGRLWLPIGLHAGWIVGAKLGNRLTAGVPGHWAAGDFTTNPLSFAALAAVGIVIWKWPRSSTS